MMKKHKWFDRPIVGMILALVITLFGVEIIGYCLGKGLEAFITDDQIASSIGVIAVSFLWLGVHCLWFKGDIHHFFDTKGLLKYLPLGWSMILLPVLTLLFNVIGGKQIGHIFLAFVLALSAGISEEVIFRVIPISVAMRNVDKEKMISTTFFLTAICFGLFHSLNVIVGANVGTTILQVIYATGVGLTYAAIYMRTGNLWVTMILHSFTDFMGFLVMDIDKTGGVMKEGSNLTAIIYLLICAIVFFVNAFMIFKKEDQKEVPAVWKKIWK